MSEPTKSTDLPLEWATTNELVAELFRRNRSTLVAYVTRDGQGCSTRFVGGRVELLGLLAMAGRDLNEVVAKED